MNTKIYINKCIGKLMFYLIFLQVHIVDAQLTAFEVKNKWGIKDIHGNIVVPAQYNFAKINFYYYNHGFVNSGGKFTNKQFTGGLWGVVNNKGSLIIDTKFEDIEGLRHTKGYFACKLNDKWGLLDSTGKEIFPLEAEIIDIKWDGNKFGMFKFKLGNKWGVMDFSGKLLLAPEYVSIGEFGYSDKLHAAIIKKDNLFGVLYSDKTIIEADYVDIHKFDFKTGKSESVAMYQTGIAKENAYDYLNELVLLRKKDNEILQTKDGNIIPSDIYKNIKKSNGIYAVYGKYGAQGLVNIKGDVLLHPQYDSIKIYGNRNCYMFIAHKNGVAAAFDTLGEEKIPFNYNDLRFYKAYIGECYSYTAKKNSKWQLLDIKGNAITELLYDDVSYHEDGYPWGLKYNNSDTIIALDKKCKLVKVKEYKPSNITYNSKSDAQIGVEKLAERLKQERSCPICTHCNGSGLSSKKEYVLEKCSSCNGSGKWTAKYGYGTNSTYKEYSCQSCSGSGKHTKAAEKKACFFCNGKGCIPKN
jgi:hypothetical protein